MASTTTARSRPSSSSTSPALRRRMHVLERAHGHAFTATTADSSTRFGEGSDGYVEEDGDGGELSPLPSPPTSFTYEEEQEAEEGEEGYDEDDDERAQGRPRVENDRNGHVHAHGVEDDAAHLPHTPRPWYQPSLPVLLALAPPIGNWLTGGDHVKDLLLLLLLVFYLHQLVEVPWNLYHAARPRRPPPASFSTSGSGSLPSAAPTPILHPASSPDISAETSNSTTHKNHAVAEEKEQARIRALARSELRTLEIFLLLLALSAPLLGVLLLRSLASLTSSSPQPHSAAGAHGSASGHGIQKATPISWFSATLFALLTALRPLRELITRVSARTSTLHTIIHAPPPPSSHFSSTHAVERREVEELKIQLGRLDAELRRLRKENSEAMQAVEVYVESALTPLEDGVRRVERRVGKLRAASKSTVGTSGKKGENLNGKADGTTFIPAPAPPSSPKGVLGLLSWFAAPTSAYTSAPPSGPAAKAKAPIAVAPRAPLSAKRRTLEVIPEDGVLPSPSAYTSAPEYFAPHAPSTSAHPSAYISTTPNAVTRTPTRSASAPTAAATTILRWCFALALWPLRVLLWPVRILAIPVRGVGRVLGV
ncbi:hypothetical protein B0H11DRAFT_2234287 [Mycena galericulata]|nr:hypothetical protein B0H11DRAFT_2234287 [Mycena galericulata]